MFLFILLILSSIIIFRFLDKKMMKVASICYLVMSVVLIAYFMLISDIKIIINKIGAEEYIILKETLIGEYSINVMLIVEIVIVLLFIISIILGVIGITNKEESIESNKEYIVVKEESIIKRKRKEQKETKKDINVYLKYCRLLN